MGMANTGQDEKGHMLRCVMPGAKLTMRAKARNALVSLRLAGSARDRARRATSKPNATNPTNAMVLAMFVFTGVAPL